MFFNQATANYGAMAIGQTGDDAWEAFCLAQRLATVSLIITDFPFEKLVEKFANGTWLREQQITIKDAEK